MKIKHLYKAFGKKNVFEDFSTELEAGKINCIVGKSGSGKTTFARILAALEKADKIELEDNFRNISFVFQEDRLLPHSTILQNVLLGKDDVQIAVDLLKKLGLEKEIDKYPDELSGGMKRRVALARALIVDFDLLILDEPFKGLDETTKQLAIQTTIEMTKQKTVLLITHDEKEIQNLGQNIIKI